MRSGLASLRWRLALLGLVVGVGVEVAAAEEFGGLAYELPAGWTQDDRGSSRVLRPAQLPSGQVVTVTLGAPAAAPAGDAVALLERLLARGNADLQSIELQGEVSAQPLNGGTFASRILVGEAPPWGRHYRWSGVFAAGGRAVEVVILARPAPLGNAHTASFQRILGSLSFRAAASPPAASSATPTGETPSLFPGMPGWLPSGRGVPIPKTALVDGKPQGVWWRSALDDSVDCYVFLPDGSFFSPPRWGSGASLDVEGQRQVSPTSVGRASVQGGQITLQRSGYGANTSAYSTGSDAHGEFFKVGGGHYRPLHPVEPRALVGRWQRGSTRYEFGPDGRFVFGQTTTTDEWMASSRASGTYQVDGWLLVLRFDGLHTTIESAGMASADLLHLGTRRLVRKP